MSDDEDYEIVPGLQSEEVGVVEQPVKRAREELLSGGIPWREQNPADADRGEQIRDRAKNVGSHAA
jgi:hypothetical protein